MKRRSTAGLAALFAAACTVAGCGGGSESGSSTAAPQAAPAPSPAASAPANAVTYHFSDCQTGAAAGCVPGDDANAGTSEATAKRTPASVDVNNLAAGSQLRFARGGAWSRTTMFLLDNNNATPASPLVLDAYGSGPRPVFNVDGVTTAAFEFGRWQNTSNDGGYVLRSLRIDGRGTSSWGLWLRDNVRHVTVDDVEITGFQIAIHSQSAAPHGVTNVLLRNSSISGNRSMGILGQFSDSVIEGNTFEGNNFVSGSSLNHAIYLSGAANGGNNNIVRNNVFRNNSVVGGVCTGGNVTMHGQMDGMLIEGNTIEVPAALPSCYGISLNPGYDTPEWFRNFTVRNNMVVNTACGICTNAGVSMVIDGNRIVQTLAQLSAINVGLATPDPGDVADTGAIIRNNTACFVVDTGQAFIRTYAGATQSNNTRISGAAATTGACAR